MDLDVDIPRLIDARLVRARNLRDAGPDTPHPEGDVPVPRLPEVLPGLLVVGSKRRVLPTTRDLRLRRFALRCCRVSKSHGHQTRHRDRSKTFHSRDTLA